MQRPRLVSLLLAAFLILTCMLFVSCFLDLEDADVTAQTPAGEDSGTTGGEVETPDENNRLSKSLSTLEPGESIEFTGLNADTEICLSDFSLEDGIYIEVVNTSRGLSRSGSGSENVFVRANGTYMPVPDSEGYARFVADCLGIIEDAKVIIHKLDKLDIDFAISPSEYPELNGIAEEFYYINFYLDPRFRGLNQKEIVLVKSGAVGAQGIAVLQRGMLNTDTEGIIDFSEKGFTGFAVNMHMVLNPESKDTMKLNVLNPIHVGTEAITLTNDLNVIMVEKRQSSSEYKVVVSFTGENAAEVIRNIAMDYNSLQIHPRYANGDNRLPCTFPEFDMDNCTITYHLGKVEKDFIFNLDYDSENTGFVSGSASVVLMEDPDGIEVHSLDDIETSVSLIAESNKITTWAFFAESPQVLEPERLGHGFINLYSYQEGRGGGSGIPQMLELQGTGFFLMYADTEEDVCLMSLNRTTWKSIDCAAVEWDPDSLDYVCVDDDCEFCAALGEKQHYSRGFIIENRKAIFTKRYITANSFGDYGRIIYGEHLSLEAENKILNTGTTGGRGHYYPMGTRAWNVDDTDTMVVVELKGIYKDPDMITCNIAIDGTEDFAIDVPMLPEDMPPEKNIVKIVISGTPVTQYEQTACNPEGLTVTAFYADGTTADVTDQAEFKTDNDSDTWGDIINYSNGSWVPDNSWHRIKAYYTENTYTWNAKTDSFYIHSQNCANTHDTAYELPYGEESYIVLDTPGFAGNISEPIVIEGEDVSGYLLESATAGADALMIFSYGQYEANSYVDFETLYGMIVQYGVNLEDNESLPAFNWYVANNETRMFVCSFSGGGELADLVIVYGNLLNDIDPEVGVKRTDFDPETTKTFFVKTVNP